ncbi:MAG: hypothetical protein HYY56_05480, partial [Candidatus Omnitrophica bacterium]|nr:hypothetical protein [Candidatus Omnitrophota bacterium]
KLRQFAEVKGTTNEDGVFKFSIEIPDYLTGQELDKGNVFVMLDASVLDKAFHEEKTTKSLVVAKDPINIEVLPESGTLAMGIENLVYIITSYPNGEIAQTDLTIGSERTKTNRLGIARVYLIPKKEKVNLRIRAEDRKGQNASVDKELTTGKPEENFILRTDKATYFGGETIHLSIISVQKGDTVFVDLVHAGQTVLTKTLEVKKGRGELALDLPPDIFGTLKVQAYKILKDGNIARDTKVIYVSQPKDLKITASLDKDIYKPGEKAKINYSVYDNEGKPTIAALGISIVDESLSAIAETHPGLEKVFFTLEKEILKPMSEICTHGAAPEELIEKETGPEINDLRLALFSVIEDKPGIGSIDETVKELEGEGYLPKRIGNRMVEDVRRAMEDPAFTSQVRRNAEYMDVLRMFEREEYLPVKSGTFEKKEKEIKEFQYEYFGKLILVIGWVVGIILPIAFFWFLIQAIRYDGFIQVLTCIAIIAILAAMLLPVFATARESARRSIPISSLHQLAIAKAQWDMEHEGKIVPVKELARREPPRIRGYFPETLYWNPELITDEKGQAQLEIELADSITTWRMTTTGVSSEGSLGGITKGIRVFSAQ